MDPGDTSPREAPDQVIAVETDGITRRFGPVLAVDHVHLAVPAGYIFGLLGPNGAGKSTLIKMLTTLLRPSEGTARVAGFDVVHDAARVRSRIGYVPQAVSADGALTGKENLRLSAALYGIPRRERDERIAELLTFMELVDAGSALVNTYSGGMVRRLELAQAMLHRPAVLFLDEPTIGLDPVARRAVWDRLREARSGAATTVLLTTHDMEEAAALCDRLAIMGSGQIAAAGTPDDLRSQVGSHATLDDVFVHFAERALHEGGTFRDVRSTRHTAARHG